MKKIAIMTAGGDCAGLNSAIKSIVMTANTQGIEVLGVTGEADFGGDVC